MTLLAAGARPAAAATHQPRAQKASHRLPAAAQADAILDNVVDRLWGRADWYWHEGRYEERVAVDRLIIRMDPKFIEPYDTAGWLLESLGRDKEALALYRQATSAAPERWETHQDLGMYLYQHHEYPEAAAEFRLGTQQTGAPVYLWKMLGHACERSGQLADALAAWKEAGRRAPNDPAVPLNMQRVQSRLEATQPH